MALFSYPVCTWLCQYVNMGVRKWLEKSAEKQKYKLCKTLNPLSRKAFLAVSFSATKDTSEQSSLCSDVLFCVQQKRTPSARSFAPPFQTEPARASIRFFFLRVQNALTALRPSRNRPPSGDLTARLCRRPEGRSTRRRVRHPASLLNRQREPGHIVVFRDAQ